MTAHSKYAVMQQAASDGFIGGYKWNINTVLNQLYVYTESNNLVASCQNPFDFQRICVQILFTNNELNSLENTSKIDLEQTQKLS